MPRMTLIEGLIGAGFAFIVAFFVGTTFVGGQSSSYSYGINGITETRCVNGMLFVVGSSGSAQQVLGPNGGGVPCN